jgi:hypothetical protein
MTSHTKPTMTMMTHAVAIGLAMLWAVLWEELVELAH